MVAPIGTRPLGAGWSTGTLEQIGELLLSEAWPGGGTLGGKTLSEPYGGTTLGAQLLSSPWSPVVAGELQLMLRDGFENMNLVRWRGGTRNYDENNLPETSNFEFLPNGGYYGTGDGVVRMTTSPTRGVYSAVTRALEATNIMASNETEALAGGSKYPAMKGKTYWYAFRFRIVSPFVDPPSSGFFLGHQPMYPTIAFHHWGFNINTVTGIQWDLVSGRSYWNGTQLVFQPATDGIDVTTTISPINLDQWHEIIVKSKMATDATGEIKVWHRMAGGSWDVDNPDWEMSNIPTMQWGQYNPYNQSDNSQNKWADEDGVWHQGTYPENAGVSIGDVTVTQKLNSYHYWTAGDTNVRVLDHNKFHTYEEVEAGEASNFSQIEADLATIYTPSPSYTLPSAYRTVLDDFERVTLVDGSHPWSPVSNLSITSGALRNTSGSGLGAAEWNQTFNPQQAAWISLSVLPASAAGFSGDYVSLFVPYGTAYYFFRLYNDAGKYRCLIYKSPGGYNIAERNFYGDLAVGDSLALVNSEQGWMLFRKRASTGNWKNEHGGSWRKEPTTQSGKIRVEIVGASPRISAMGGGSLA